MGEAIELQNLGKRYGSRHAVKEVNISIGEGEFFTLLGASGSGKTTTLMAIAGFVHPDEGDIRIGKRSVVDLLPEKRNLGVVFQSYALFPNMDVGSNIAFPLRMRRLGKSEREERVKRALDLVGLSGYADRRINQLSGGQQQRIALARALVFEPPVLLMDEPLGALDRQLRDQLQFEIKKLQRRVGVTVCYVTHDQEEALVMSDRIAVMADACLQDIGAPRAVYDRPGNLFVGKFLGESNVLKGIARPGAKIGLTTIDVNGIELTSRLDESVSGHVSVFIRPENINFVDKSLISNQDESCANTVSGVIDGINYLGSYMRFSVNTPIGPIIARSPKNGVVEFLGVGDQVFISWRPRDSLIYNDSGEAIG